MESLGLIKFWSYDDDYRKNDTVCFHLVVNKSVDTQLFRIWNFRNINHY